MADEILAGAFMVALHGGRTGRVTRV